MKRVATALVGIPITLLIVRYAPTWIFGLFTAAVAALCFEELLSLGAERSGVRPGRWILFAGGAVTACAAAGPSWLLGALAASLFVSMGALAFGSSLETVLPKIALGVLGILYCCFLFGFVLLLPRNLVLVLLGLIWAGDSAAYYCGRAFGRHALAPRLSPKKTIEGAFAGLIASMIAGVLLGVWITDASAVTLLMGALAAAGAGQAGDLMESALKRSAGVKDSSGVLPGHGGMLDRVDSLLFAAPVFYWFLGA